MGGRRGWLFAAGICLAVVLIPLTGWLLSAGTRGAEIANILALPVSLLALFFAAVGILPLWIPARTHEGSDPSLPPVGAWVHDAFAWVRRRFTVKVALTLAVVLPLVAIGVLWGDQLRDRASIWASGCGHPTQLRVLTSPDQLEPTRQLADEYARWAAKRNYGCAVVRAYVFAPSAKEARDALAAHWSGTQLRDLGPRPDVWLADSESEVDKVWAAAEELEADSPIVHDVAIAWSPVVVGIPAWAAPELGIPRRGHPWSGFFRTATEPGWDLVRPDPASSPAGELATAMLYEAGDPRTVEQRIGRSLDDGGYPLGGGLDVLCRYRQLDRARTAVVVSEQALARFNRGDPLGGECRGAGNRRDGDDVLLAYYPSDTHALEHRFVRFGWSGQPQRAQAETFGGWLAGDGRPALAAAGLRPPELAAADPLSERHGVLAEATFNRDPIADDTLERALRIHDSAQRRGRVLLAVDGSGSMGQSAGGGQGSRFDVASRGIVRALELMGERDEFGLWIFPGDPAGTRAREAVPIGSQHERVGGIPRREATKGALGQVLPGGYTPLFRTIVDGVGAVGPSDDTRISALVVLTDGEDTTSGLTAVQAQDAARKAGVRVFVVAVGEATCSSIDLDAAATGGRCVDADLRSVDAELVGLFNGLWGAGQ